jgi:hypothetical protein
MVAIEITQESKDKNSKFFKNDSVGTIVIKKIPKKFHGVEDINAGGYEKRTDLHLADGFKQVIKPPFDKDTQELGAVIPNDESTFTYEVLLSSQETLDEKFKDDFKNNLDGVFAYAITPDGTKEYAIKIKNDGKIQTVLIPTE